MTLSRFSSLARIASSITAAMACEDSGAGSIPGRGHPFITGFNYVFMLSVSNITGGGNSFPAGPFAQGNGNSTAAALQATFGSGANVLSGQLPYFILVNKEDISPGQYRLKCLQSLDRIKRPRGEADLESRI